MYGKGYMIFSAPAVYAVYQNIVYDVDIDITLFVVAIVTSLVGSTMQITHKNLELQKKGDGSISGAEIWAIYITGLVFGMIAYFIGYEKKNIFYAMLIGIFGSYMSLDLFTAIKKATLYLAEKLPDIIVEQYLKSKNDNDDKE